jgi:S-adenosylmethionine/arginine decarboxylase-like enzyme
MGEKQVETIAAVQGPHCLVDFHNRGRRIDIGKDAALELVFDLARALRMKRLEEPRIVNGGDGRLSVYQIVSNSHIIIHFGIEWIHADLFSCEPFNMDRCVNILLHRLGGDAVIQYCQRNLLTAPRNTAALPMKRMNRLTSNPRTFTHALINWYGGDEKLLGDIKAGTAVMEKALKCLKDNETLPHSEVVLIKVDPIPDSWDNGGFSGGYINLMRQITIHTFIGINGAYTDIMAHCFDLERIIRIVGKGFHFKFFEVDGIFQRSAP